MSTRIHELAKKYNREPKALLAWLRERGFVSADIKSVSSPVGKIYFDELDKAFGEQVPTNTPAPFIMPKKIKVRRRRSKHPLFSQPTTPTKPKIVQKGVAWVLGKDTTLGAQPATTFDPDSKRQFVFVGCGSGLPTQNDKSANLPSQRRASG